MSRSHSRRILAVEGPMDMYDVMMMMYFNPITDAVWHYSFSK